MFQINEQKPLVPRPQLAPNIPTSMTTYKTVEGEYLLLGHHTYPRIIMKHTIHFTDPTSLYFTPTYRIEFDETDKDSGLVSQPPQYTRAPRIAGQRQIPRIQYKPENEDKEPSLLELLIVFWNSHPIWMMSVATTVVALTFATIYMCGRQSGFNLSSSISQQSREVSHASQRSRAYSTEASSKPWGFLSRGSKASTTTINDDDFDPSIPPGWRQIGKIQYNPNAVLGKGCDGTMVYK